MPARVWLTRRGTSCLPRSLCPPGAAAALRCWRPAPAAPPAMWTSHSSAAGRCLQGRSCLGGRAAAALGWGSAGPRGTGAGMWRQPPAAWQTPRLCTVHMSRCRSCCHQATWHAAHGGTNRALRTMTTQDSLAAHHHAGHISTLQLQPTSSVEPSGQNMPLAQATQVACSITGVACRATSVDRPE